MPQSIEETLARARARSRAARVAHPEVIKARKHADYLKHKEEYNSKSRNYYATNRAKLLAQKRAYTAANKDMMKQRKQQEHARHKEARNAKARASYAEHQAERQEYAHAYYAKHPEIILANNARRRARIAAAPINDLTAAQWRAIKDHYKHRCVYCGRQMQRLTQDHIIPISKGGSHTVSNVVPACQTCNFKKHTGPPPVPIQPLLLVVEDTKKKAS